MTWTSSPVQITRVWANTTNAYVQTTGALPSAWKRLVPPNQNMFEVAVDAHLRGRSVFIDLNGTDVTQIAT
jgi:hypothetical protein